MISKTVNILLEKWKYLQYRTLILRIFQWAWILKPAKILSLFPTCILNGLNHALQLFQRCVFRPTKPYIYTYMIWMSFPLHFGLLTLIEPGGGHNGPPLDISRYKSAARNFLTAPFADFLLSSLAQLLRPNLSRPRLQFLSHAPSKKCCQAENCSKTWFCVQSQCKLCLCILFINMSLFSCLLVGINLF